MVKEYRMECIYSKNLGHDKSGMWLGEVTVYSHKLRGKPTSYSIIAIPEEGVDRMAPRIDPDIAESLANAMLDDLGKGWKPYPENKPTASLFYEVTVLDDGIPVTTSAFWNGSSERFDDGCWSATEIENVIAFKEQSAPFQPEEQ